jgi:cobalamin biosynthesis protein CobT
MNKAQAVMELTQLGLQYNLPPDMIQQAIVEIVSGAKETPTADQMMSMVEQQVQQQNQVIDQGQQVQNQMMLEQQVMAEEPTGDEVFEGQKTS